MGRVQGRADGLQRAEDGLPEAEDETLVQQAERRGGDLDAAAVAAVLRGLPGRPHRFEELAYDAPRAHASLAIPAQLGVEEARAELGEGPQGAAAQLLQEEAHDHGPLQQGAGPDLRGGLELDEVRERPAVRRAPLRVPREGRGQVRVPRLAEARRQRRGVLQGRAAALAR